MKHANVLPLGSDLQLPVCQLTPTLQHILLLDTSLTSTNMTAPLSLDIYITSSPTFYN